MKNKYILKLDGDFTLRLLALGNTAKLILSG
jgi:hypothetical protein